MTPQVSWRGPRIAGLALLALGVAALVATTRIPSARDGWAVSGPPAVCEGTRRIHERGSFAP